MDSRRWDTDAGRGLLEGRARVADPAALVGDHTAGLQEVEHLLHARANRRPRAVRVTDAARDQVRERRDVLLVRRIPKVEGARRPDLERGVLRAGHVGNALIAGEQRALEVADAERARL